MTDKPETPASETEEDLKDKFKQALEQKIKGSRSRQAHQEGRTRVGAMQGPAARKRTFRRKTG